ncbi:flagellar protein FlaF [Rhodobacter sp. JA431]|uniref:flagellar biosynthesis regulator FlaF n=1 Tax=Rhodobacter sp. JA431 TaxID=570013 RepID=UPI000BC5DC75|nr:flagellar biosynthesis regulator FlaF [Rhodobacter sp. JA431]SOC07828.1 flagellar protein FlaF [Rhodobacter sp. JA431]
MNATILAKTAYSNPGQPTRTLRGTEYEIFARVTHRLKVTAGMAKSNFPALVSALYDNRKLWTTLAVDVAQPNNELPEMLRARIFYLNEFTQQHSAKVLKGDGAVDVLIDINTAIMRGLRREGGAE